VQETDPTEIAIRQLGLRRIFWHGERRIVLACLIREKDRRPLRADWWRGKDVSIIAVDLDGNFFLHHCDGSVRYWDHQLQAEAVIAPSVRDFVAKIVE
jgi:hypothetical protein